MVRYEYRYEQVDEGREWEEVCNRLGSEGWRLFKMQQKWEHSINPIICYFVREVPA